MKRIKLTDIKVLLQLFAAPHFQLVIFDPLNKLVEDTPFSDSKGMQRVLVNLAPQICEYKGEAIDSFDLILDFGKGNHPFPHKKTFNVINHRDGSLRWLCMPGRLASALTFYNQLTWRSKLIAAGINMLAFCKLDFAIRDAKLSIYAKEALKLDQHIPDRMVAYTVSFGVPGEERSVSIALESPNRVEEFIKIPTTRKAAELLIKEKEGLIKQAHTSQYSFIAPKLTSTLDPMVLGQENIAGGRFKKASGHFGALKAAVVAEMAKTTGHTVSISQTAYWPKISERIRRLKSSDDFMFRKMGLLLETLKAGVDDTKFVFHHAAHGDFTPWNMFSDGKKIGLIDWEMYCTSAPALFDVFHFVYQTEILVHANPMSSDCCALQSAMSHDSLQQMIETYALDLETLHSLYLLDRVSYCAESYANQALSSSKAFQLKAWSNAIKQRLASSCIHTDARMSFLTQFNAFVKGYPHAFMKFEQKAIEDLPLGSDLDIAIGKSCMSQVQAFCASHPYVAKYLLKKTSYMSVFEIFFLDGGYLSIDCIHDFKRRSIRYLNASEVMKDARDYRANVFTASVAHDIEYMLLFYNLNKGVIPCKYYRFLKDLSQFEVLSAIEQFNRKYRTGFSGIESLFVKHEPLRRRLTKKFASRSFFRWSKDTGLYIADAIRNFVRRKGIVLTFTGVDGVGKSTVVNAVTEVLVKKYRKEVVLLHHRPGILPILSTAKYGDAKRAEHIASVSAPRNGKNTNVMSSLIRFAYYYSDYLIGQFYVHWKYVYRGKIVIYDRYYFDFINDAKRSNIQLKSNKLSRALYMMLIKPSLNFFLYADSRTVLSRKRELSLNEIVSLNNGYHALFNELKDSKKDRYQSIENLCVEDTVNTILRAYSLVA